MRISAKTSFLSLSACFFLLTSAYGQNFEIGANVGGQFNGGLDLSTTIFHRIEVGNALNYGVTVGYLLGEHYGVEFQWNENNAETRAQPIGIGSSIKLFNLHQNQYMGNFLLHLTDREARLRPFVFFGLGANNLNPNVSAVNSTTRFAVSLGAGAKYDIGKHFGLRTQLKWSPTYITTTNGGYWCDPFWGGCWTVGNSHYLHEFDITGGFTLRF
jgi:hypothetical protein